MALLEKDCSWDVSISFCRWAELFAETMKKRQISFADWHELLTAPLDNSFGAEYEEVLVRLVYGVQHGIVKVVEKPSTVFSDQ